MEQSTNFLAGRANQTLVSKLSRRFRERRDRGLKALIDAELARQDARPFTILDLGGTPAYWQRLGADWLASRDVRVTITNFEAGELLGQTDAFMAVEQADGRDLAKYADGSVSLVHSNSVIEHVGRWADMERFAAETRRVGRAYYVQTPYFWFPVDPHFFRVPLFHWLPVSLRAKLLRRIKIGWARTGPTLAAAMRAIEGSTMLDRSQFRQLFPDAAHGFEWLGLPKSMIAVRKS